MGNASVVLWDVGGTLLTRPPILDGIDRILHRVGLGRDQLRMDSVNRAIQRWFRTLDLCRTAEEERTVNRRLAAILLDGTAAGEGEVATLTDLLADYYDFYQVAPGIRDLLEELAAREVRQAVVSNWPPSLRGLLDHHVLSQYFAVIVISGEEGIRKPDPRMFQRALRRLGVAPEQAVYVGNNPEVDLPPARQLGLRAVHFDPGNEHPRAEARDVRALRAVLFETLGLSAAF